jgi:hypothetical protein
VTTPKAPNINAKMEEKLTCSKPSKYIVNNIKRVVNNVA